MGTSAYFERCAQNDTLAMLLGKKSKPERQLDWAVILDRAADDFAKKRVSQKLAQVFHLSLQEAGDLTENTPLILFDQLSEDVA